MADLYEKFISNFESKINQLRFVQIMTRIANTLSSPEQSIAFMQAVLDKRERLGEEAAIVAQMAIAQLHVKRGSPENLDIAESIMDTTRPTLARLEGSGSEAVVNSSFFRVAAEFYKVRGPPERVFTRPRCSFSRLRRTTRSRLRSSGACAVDMALAAIIAKNVFGFGEILAEPLVQVLDGTPSEWLHALLKVFAEGDIDGFAALVSQHKEAIESSPALMGNFETLKQKIALVALMRLVFERPPGAPHAEL